MNAAQLIRALLELPPDMPITAYIYDDLAGDSYCTEVLGVEPNGQLRDWAVV